MQLIWDVIFGHALPLPPLHFLNPAHGPATSPLQAPPRGCDLPKERCAQGHVFSWLLLMVAFYARCIWDGGFKGARKRVNCAIALGDAPQAAWPAPSRGAGGKTLSIRTRPPSPHWQSPGNAYPTPSTHRLQLHRAGLLDRARAGELAQGTINRTSWGSPWRLVC